MNESKEQLQENCEHKRRGFNMRGFFSLLLFTSYTLLAFTGVILYMTPKGQVAHWTGWTMLGLEKEEWSGVHMTLAIIALVASGFHLYYNWTIFWCYIKRKSQAALNLKREMALALLLSVITVVGTLYGTPPFGTIVRWNDDIKEYWKANSAPAPTPHAEDFSLKRLADEIGLPPETMIERLENAEIEVEDLSVIVGDLARTHNMAPSELFAIIEPDYRAMKGRGQGGGRGMGRGTGQ